jgi:import receptor subunit TOM22
VGIAESEISVESDYDLEAESLYDRLYALKDIVPPSARLQVNSSVSYVTSLAKSSIAFSGKALWILSTSAFLLGVPWALAYAEEEQYIQMEREQGMIKGANEVCRASTFLIFIGSFPLFRPYSTSDIVAQ